jgi:hypothetical protein
VAHHLCCEDDSGPGYDLWHVLFECATTSNPVIVGQCRVVQSYMTDLCDHIVKATQENGACLYDLSTCLR